MVVTCNMEVFWREWRGGAYWRTAPRKPSRKVAAADFATALPVEGASVSRGTVAHVYSSGPSEGLQHKGDTMNVHERLKELLRGVKQAEVAAAVEVSASTVSQWLNGRERCPPPHLANLVCLYAKGDSKQKQIELARLITLNLQERLKEHPGQEDEGGGKWIPGARELMEQCLLECHTALDMSRSREAKTSGRTLADFPESFYPMVVVSGDKREVSEARINAGDFGAVSASPAETRWIAKLRLREDVEFFGDKIFILASVEELRERFGKTNILVLGSPAANHLARRCLLKKRRLGWRPAAPIFRFNFDQEVIEDIESLLDKISTFNARQLVGKQGDPDTDRQVKHWLHDLFTGGILDPTNHDSWLRGRDMLPVRDFGLLSLARNPLSAEEEPYVCIFAAGFHMFGTAHAIKMLSDPECFENHPLGGVLRVSMDLGHPFHIRFDESTAKWDDEVDDPGPQRTGGKAPQRDRIVEGLKTLRENIPTRINVTVEEIDECLKFIEAL